MRRLFLMNVVLVVMTSALVVGSLESALGAPSDHPPMKDPLFASFRRLGELPVSATQPSRQAHPAMELATAEDPRTVELADRSLWVTNGEVRSMLLQDDHLYIGGKFNVVGPETGGGACVDTQTGSIRQTPLDLLWGYGSSAGLSYGSVFAATSDGAGGWFIGGAFSTVQGRPFVNIAYIGADGAVLDWHADTNGEVRSIARDGSVLYVAGAFTMIGGEERWGVAALDASTGAVRSWDPHANYFATSIVPKGGAIFVGGAFNRIGGAARTSIAALDPVTGAALEWDPSLVLHQPPWSPVVESLMDGGSCLYVGGVFDSIGG